jgi:hypothetical protein
MKLGYISCVLFPIRWGTLIDIALVTLFFIFYFVHPAAATTWTVVQQPDAQSKTEICMMQSPTQLVHDGYYGTQVQLIIRSEAVLVVAHAPFDPSFNDIGMQVDQHALIRLDEVVDRKTARFATSYATLIKQFKKGSRVQLQMRFWPTWPTTGPHTAAYSLIGFTKAYADLQVCQDKSQTVGGAKP